MKGRRFGLTAIICAAGLAITPITAASQIGALRKKAEDAKKKLEDSKKAAPATEWRS